MLNCDGVGPADKVSSAGCCQTVVSSGLFWSPGDSGAGIGMGGGDGDRSASAI